MKILIVDDDEMIRQSLGMLLEGRGHEISVAGDGAAALEALAMNSFDVMVTDIIMPFKEGIETISKARKDSRTLKIIAISGGGRAGISEFLDLAVKAGADEALRKPFRGEELIAKIEEPAARIIMPESYGRTHRVN